MCAGNIFMIFCYWLMVPFSVGSGNIDMDYYFGQDPLRSQDQLCYDPVMKLYCRAKCGEKPGLCLRNQCYCIEDVATSSSEETLPIDEDSLYAYRPTLRHHIAHFCPNLDKARECIRKCMREGKPAFCGKDHNCYCGHRYDDKDSGNDKKDPKKQYSQFQDLYEKYFGPNSDSNEDEKSNNHNKRG